MKKATTKTMTLTNCDVLDQLADAMLRATREVYAIRCAVTPDRVAPLSEQANAAAKAGAPSS